MSSKLNRQDEKKVTSITRKIHNMWLGERIRRLVSSDILLFIILYASAVIANAYMGYGDNMIAHYHALFAPMINSTNDEIAIEASKELLLSGQMMLFTRYIIISMSGIVFFQILGVIIGYSSTRRKISNILKPINDMAIKADELSRLNFDEDKYRVLEDAIDNLRPEENDTLSFNNEDLKGVEAAMNNLIKRMRDTYRQQARFVNDASHELRTPIAVIEGYANMLCRWGKEDEEVLDESITAIKNESAHMKYLVEQLLFLARGDSGKTEIKKEEIVLNDLMKEIYEESLMIDEEHTYRYKQGDKTVIINGDSGLLKQAVRILVDNAAKYTNKGDEIILSIGTDENHHPYMQVQDSGIGMEMADVEHMFDRFYRADKARNTAGTGLGLSIAKWIVDKHKGHFEITSITDLGTRIRMVLE